VASGSVSGSAHSGAEVSEGRSGSGRTRGAPLVLMSEQQLIDESITFFAAGSERLPTR